MSTWDLSPETPSPVPDLLTPSFPPRGYQVGFKGWGRGFRVQGVGFKFRGVGCVFSVWASHTVEYDPLMKSQFASCN